MSSLARLLVGLGIICFSSGAQAFRISPMVIKFAPEGAGRTQVLVLENPAAERVPVQIEVFRRLHADGKETREKSAEFSVYPEQLVLLPNERRNVRLTWNGPKPSAELAYRVVVSQLPVAFKPKKDAATTHKVSLNLLLQYVASAYVVPPDVRPEIRVESFRVSEKGAVEVVVKNGGGAHLVLKKTELIVKDGEGREKKRLKEPKGLEAENLLAGESRSFVLEGEGLTAGEGKNGFKAELKFEESVD